MESRRAGAHRQPRPHGQTAPAAGVGGSEGHLDLSTRAQGDLTVIHVRGELDVVTSGPFHHHLDSARHSHGDRLVLDLAELSFLDCSSLRMLTRHHEDARRHGGCLALAAPQPVVTRMLSVTGMATRLSVYDSVPAAVRACASVT